MKTSTSMTLFWNNIIFLDLDGLARSFLLAPSDSCKYLALYGAILFVLHVGCRSQAHANSTAFLVKVAKQLGQGMHQSSRLKDIAANLIRSVGCPRDGYGDCQVNQEVIARSTKNWTLDVSDHVSSCCLGCRSCRLESPELFSWDAKYVEIQVHKRVHLSTGSDDPEN